MDMIERKFGNGLFGKISDQIPQSNVWDIINTTSEQYSKEHRILQYAIPLPSDIVTELPITLWNKLHTMLWANVYELILCSISLELNALNKALAQITI